MVDCAAYLSDLPAVNRTITSLAELDDFDRIVVCAGADSIKLADLPIHAIGGQLIELLATPAPATPISGQIYVIPLEDRLIVGSTYERQPQSAEGVRLPKLKEMLPALQVDTILQVKKAFRASAPGHLPLIRQLNPKTWAFTGLGSKGLLYHAYFAKKLASLMRLN